MLFRSSVTAGQTAHGFIGDGLQSEGDLYIRFDDPDRGGTSAEAGWKVHTWHVGVSRVAATAFVRVSLAKSARTPPFSAPPEYDSQVWLAALSGKEGG